MVGLRLKLASLMAGARGSVDPLKFPHEQFELFSIPSYDRGLAEIQYGRDIGSTKQIVEQGDILVSKIVPHIRRAWVVTASRGFRQIASGEWIVFRDARICPGYFRHYLLSDAFHRQFMQTVSGVGGSLLRAKPKLVGEFEMALPSLDEQKRISELLDKADEIRKMREVAIAKLDQLAHGVFVDMFGDPIKNERQYPMMTIGDLCRLVRGSSPRPQGDPRYFGGPVPRLMVADLTRDGWLVTPKIDSLTVEGSRKSRPVKAGTVVMAVSGNVGLVSRLAVDACIHDGFVAFTDLNEEKCTPSYLLALLHFSKSAHDKNKAGAIFINLKTEDIKAMKLPLPPLEKQDEFEKKLQAVERFRGKMKGSEASMSALGESLQNAAFSAGFSA